MIYYKIADKYGKDQKREISYLYDVSGTTVLKNGEA